MSKGNTLIKIIVAGAAIFGAYKFIRALDKADRERKENLENHRKTVIEEIEGELHQADEFHQSITDITLNNEKLSAADRAYAYELFKEKYISVVVGKTIKEIDDARKDLEEYIDIFINTKDPETIHTFLQINIERRTKADNDKAAKEAREADIEKYRAIGEVIEKIGTKVVCDLVQ